MCYLHQSSEPTRRQFIRDGLSVSAAIIGAVPTTIEWCKAAASVSPNMSNIDIARAAGRWIESAKVVTDTGVTWLADPTDPESAGTTLYHGSPGVVLFLLDLYHATGEEGYLNTARSGADAIMAVLQTEAERQLGLYTGVAGMVFCLAETYSASNDSRYRTAAAQGLNVLLGAATRAGSGVEWNAVTDVISGSSGIGLTLLDVANTIEGADVLDVAASAAYRLVELGRPTSHGLKWPMSPDYRRLMPNFSHGTAGVSYYLATLYQKTGDKDLLDASLAGARYLQSVATTGDGDICLVFHNEPDGKDLYYLSWCHGPVGTARLFYRLANVTQDDEWLQWANMCAKAITQSGIPEQRRPGFWNNVSQCCGDAGVGEFFSSMYQVTGDRTYYDFLQRVRGSLVERATEDSSGIRWLQAEHRTRPELVAAQTGYMQGAAGIASFFLHLDALESGRESTVVLPDSPFTL